MQTLWLNSNKQHKRTSSCLGVSWDAKQNAWWAKLNVNGRRYDLGLHSGQISAYSEMTAKFGRPTNVIEDGSATVSRPSVVRSKPAIRGHFKTGHMALDLDVVLCRSLSLQV